MREHGRKPLEDLSGRISPYYIIVSPQVKARFKNAFQKFKDANPNARQSEFLEFMLSQINQ